VYVALIFVALFLVDVCGLKKVQKIKSSSLKSTLQLPFLSPPLILQPTFPLFRFLSARNRNRTPRSKLVVGEVLLPASLLSSPLRSSLTHAFC
jgi:hypothetical protein